MPLAAAPQVLFNGVWYNLTVVTDAPPGGARNLDPEGLEYRYWSIALVLAGVAENIIGRILVAGPDKATPPAGSIVIPSVGRYNVHLRAVDSPETVIVPAGQLVCKRGA